MKVFNVLKPRLHLLILCAGLLISAPAVFAQDQLYWEDPEIIGVPDGRFAETIVSGEGVVLVWQEFSGDKGSLEASIAIRARFSADGTDWSGPIVTIAEDIPYLWLEEIPLFSAASGRDGHLVVAVTRGPSYKAGEPLSSADAGVAIYRQDDIGGASFSREALLASSPEYADTAVAPRLAVGSDGSYILFLTRRTPIEGGLRSTTLTIFASYSDFGRQWGEPELFINPETDRGATDITGARAVLEQNFLPHLLSIDSVDYVAFQTLRQGPEGQVYQIYIKSRNAGGEWGSASPVTESLVPSSVNDNNPLQWDNQRPHLGLTSDREIFLTFERRFSRDNPTISGVILNRDGSPSTLAVEDITKGGTSGFFPQTLSLGDSTWILWFDDSGIRLARRDGIDVYTTELSNLDARSPGADRGTASFPRGIIYKDETYILWQDRAGGSNRSIFLSPDLTVGQPEVNIRGVTSGRPGNRSVLEFSWSPADDSSGISSHSWLWSRNPDATPSRADLDQIRTPPYVGNIDLATLRNPDDLDGTWYFSIIAGDEAGNWSEPLRISYILDTKPPPPPLVKSPPVDADGYLRSNTFGVSWEDAEGEAADAYRWRLDYFGNNLETLASIFSDSFDAISYDENLFAPLYRAESVQSRQTAEVWQNLDNGIWAFSVASTDLAGNVGESSTLILLAQNYIPVTRITGVTARKDSSERTILRITGRGFLVGGRLTHGIIDGDGEAPWDYEYSADREQIRVYSDTVAEIIGIEGMEEGSYYIGVRHPVRGDAFWNRKMKLEAGGNVKFGPFGLYKYESLWEPAARLFRVSGNEMLLVLLLLLGVSSVLITTFRLISITRESVTLERNARAIIAREPMSTAAGKQAAAMLRSKGMGLRKKFMLWFTLMVIITILMIAIVLGVVWISMERDTLAEGLESQSRLLTETLTTTAATSISNADRATLFLLPDRIGALPDALWTTVTGPRSETVNGQIIPTTDGFEYVWVSNDDGILDRLALPVTLGAESMANAVRAADESEKELLTEAYVIQSDDSAVLDAQKGQDNHIILATILRRVNLMPSETGYGVSEINDGLSRDIRLLQEEVELEVQEAGILEMSTDLAVLENNLREITRQAAITLEFDTPEFQQASDAVEAQKREIETLLLEVSNRKFLSYPEFTSDVLRDRDITHFIFYKPILYRSGVSDVNFYKGTVRLAVSVENVRNQLALVQRRIILITIIAAIAALGLGVLASMFISSLVVRPIIRLVDSVNIIREQPDMLQHEEFDVGIDTGDELTVLASSINDMVHGLVEAAVEQKELVAGQEIQKTFLPLDSGKSGSKLSTGGAGNAFFRLFGYYEGADAVSGDYFDFRKLDEDHYVMIKLDIAGHGVTASLIMVQVAALYVDYFRRIRDRAIETGVLNYDLRDFTFGINDLINEIGFRGRFAAFNLSVINVRTSEYQMINAGDNLVRVYDGQTRKVKVIELPDGPAAGQISSDMIKMKDSMYSVVSGSIKRGDIMFLFTDGIEEAHHILRNESFEVIQYREFDRSIVGKDQVFIEPTYETTPERMDEEGELVETPTLDAQIDAALNEDLRIRKDGSKYKQINAGQDNEEFDTTRIDDIIEAVMNKGSYVLERRCDVTIGKPLHFDFSTLEGNAEDAIMALASIEKVFRIIPEGSAGNNSRVRVDRKISEFLEGHFAEFDEFYGHPVDDNEGYIFYSHLDEDVQDDDLTIWAYERL